MFIFRTICQVIDQIRLFKQNRYIYETDKEVQEALLNRIMEFAHQDLHQLASQQETNYQRQATNASKMKGFFKFAKK